MTDKHNDTSADGGRRDPELWWSVGDQLHEIGVRWRFATVSALINFGDGTARQVIGVNERKDHIYPFAGAYKVTIRQAGGTNPILAEAQIVVRDTNPDLTIGPDAELPGVALATAPAALDSTGIIARYRVFWNYFPQPTLYTDFWGMPAASVRHQMSPGSYKARVMDLGTKRWVEPEYTIPEPDLDFSTTLVGTHVTLNVTHATGGKPLVVAWGDTGLVETVDGNRAEHTYPARKNIYLVQLWYADASGSVTKTVGIEGEKA